VVVGIKQDNLPSNCPNATLPFPFKAPEVTDLTLDNRLHQECRPGSQAVAGITDVAGYLRDYMPRIN
jgi:hypothetical protein